jgi:hypothetical protein
VITNDGKYTAKEYLVEVGNPVPLRSLKPEKRPIRTSGVMVRHLIA